MYLTQRSEITEFLEDVGEQETLKSYEVLTDAYGERLDATLQVTDTEDEPSYTLTVDHPARRKAQENGQPSGKGTQVLSRLLGRGRTWPQEFSGELSTTEEGFEPGPTYR